MWRDIFNPENLVFRMLSKGVDFVGLSLLWLLLCIPIVTIGPATAALYYTVVKVFRQKKGGRFSDISESVPRKFKAGNTCHTGLPSNSSFLAWGYNVMASNVSTSAGVVMYMAYYVVLLVPAAIFCYLFPLMGRFSFQTGALFRTAFIMALRHLPSTIIIVMLTVEMTVYTLEKWWPVFITPVLTILLASLFLERIFPKYLSKEELEKFGFCR